MLLGPAIKRFILQAVLTDTLLENMLVMLLMLVRSTTARTSSLGSAGQFTAAVGGSC